MGGGARVSVVVVGAQVSGEGGEVRGRVWAQVSGEGGEGCGLRCVGRGGECGGVKW